jgi:hypothetical protein
MNSVIGLPLGSMLALFRVRFFLYPPKKKKSKKNADIDSNSDSDSEDGNNVQEESDADHLYRKRIVTRFGILYQV